MDLTRVITVIANRINIVDSGCWEWKLKVRNNGYARVTYKRKSWYAHRLSYLAFNGILDNSLDVCHSCDNRKCVNPAHLWQGTRKDNMQDAVEKGRQAKGDQLPQTKIHGETLKEVLKMAKGGVMYKDIAHKYNVTTSCIGRIARKNDIRRKRNSK